MATMTMMEEPQAMVLMAPSKIELLPIELKLDITSYVCFPHSSWSMILIISQLYRRRDLLNLSMTCKDLEDVVLRRLYQNVNVEMPQSKTMSWNMGPLPHFRKHVVASMQELTLRNGYMDPRDPVYSRRRRSDRGSIDAYVKDLVSGIPDNQLKSFSYLHRTPMSLDLFAILQKKHGRSLKELRFYEIEMLWHGGMIPPQNLNTIECRSVHESDAIGAMVVANKNTLQRLRLGQEMDLVEQYRHSRVGFLDRITQPLDLFTSDVKLPLLPNLREIALFGLDVTSLIPQSVSDALFFCQIEHMTLESCNGVTPLLETLAGTFHYAQNTTDMQKRTPKMAAFLFRHEAFSAAMKDSLIRFLASFRGLETLSLLFENATFLERPSALIAEHGPTLKSLVLESRIQPREHLGLDPSRPFGVGGFNQQLWEESIQDICDLCPNLIELGTGFPWNDEMVRIRRSALPSLTKLRTIHIRNFPESQVLSQLGDYSIKEYATKFIEWVYPALVGGSRPALETLAIGPTLYETRWKSNPARRMPPEFLRTHHYCLDWAKTRFGRWSPLITGVSERYMEEYRGSAPLGGIFEQLWLR
jgi:hypothetical protein